MPDVLHFLLIFTRNSWDAGALQLEMGAWLTCYSPTCVIIPNYVALGQTVLAYRGFQNFGDAWAHPYGSGRG